MRGLDMSKIDAVRFVLQCKNWREIVVPIATHKPLNRIVLRKGSHFEASMVHWYDVNYVYFRNVYNPVKLPIEKNDVVADIGANFGIFTVYAASRTQNAVYTFEPSPSNFEALKHNINTNGLNNVIPFQIAVSNRCGIELLFDSEDSTSSQLKSVSARTGVKYIEVRSITLQDIMDGNNIELIDFLKMDCEGSEELIMESISKDYLRRIRKIAMEFHDNSSKLKHDDIRKLLEQVGFITPYFKKAKQS
jgi:FkbM family methyltransferase